MKLQKAHLENCYKQYLTTQDANPYRLSSAWYLGYMEACLVQFGVIESKSNGVVDYQKTFNKKFLFWEYEVVENREQIIVRLVKEYLANNSNNK
jgi:hypothetical protein